MIDVLLLCPNLIRETSFNITSKIRKIIIKLFNEFIFQIKINKFKTELNCSENS